jgi:transposase
MAYDAVFRKRVIEFKEAGHTFGEVYEAFKVDSKRYYSWKKQLEDTGSQYIKDGFYSASTSKVLTGRI